MEIFIVTVILGITLVLLITEKIPIDLTAIGIMVALLLSGILTTTEAVRGFANPAVITVGAMFLVSRAMVRTGAVGFVAQKLIKYSRGRANVAMLLTLLIVGVASAFINNTPVVVLFIPIILDLGCEYSLSPSKLLIPVSYASILAGTCTLIGTSTNIIVSDLSFHYGYGRIGMFELAVVGVPIAVLGIAFLCFAAPRLMPGYIAPTCESPDRPDRRFLAEFVITPESSLIGTVPVTDLSSNYPSLEVCEVARDSHLYYPVRETVILAADDLLLVKGSANDMISILREKDVVLSHMASGLDFSAGKKESLIAELIITPQSPLPGERLLETELHSDPEIHIIAVKRRSVLYTEQKIENLKLNVGDIILIWCSEDKLESMRSSTDFIIVEDIHHEIINKQKAPLTILIFAGLVVSAATGLADIMLSALAALFLMVVTGCLHLRDAYRALQANVLLLIIGTIALGIAMEKTGASKLYAELFLDIFRGFGPKAILGCILLLTSVSTQVLSNSATAVLIVPIAISTALALGVSPRPFIIAVCFGASACFATPIGYQTNLLVYGPGGYRFSDYLKLGIPLNLLVLTLGMILIPYFWPF